jgi:hypothetical protein
MAHLPGKSEGRRKESRLERTTTLYRFKKSAYRRSSKLEMAMNISEIFKQKLCRVTVDFPAVKAQNTVAMRNRSSRSDHQK